MSLSDTNWKKVITGALIAGAGAALTFLSQWATGQDFGEVQPIITAVFSVAVNFVRKLAQGENG